MSLSQSSPQSIPVLLYKVEATDVFPLIDNFFAVFPITTSTITWRRGSSLPFLPAPKQ